MRTNATKHTPGPWSVLPVPLADRSISGLEVGNYEGDNLRTVCDVPYMGGTDTEDEANARLIAASPDLLAAAKFAVKSNAHRDAMDCGGSSNGCDDCIGLDALCVAILKAEGRG